jgi:NADPH:quinone reductase-like Zn-dependent oxidoreductase
MWRSGDRSNSHVWRFGPESAKIVIDYTKRDFTKNGETYDVIFDVVGKLSFSRCKGSLKEKEVYLATLPTLAILLQMVWP